jgi:hypothetical protein
MPGKTAAPHEIPYALEEDKPPSMEAASKPAAERVHKRLNEIAPSQIVGVAKKQLLIANAAGVVTAVTASGDVTNNESGVFTIGAKKVTLAMLAEALGLTEGYLADKAVSSRKLSYATMMGRVKATSNLTTSPTAFTLVPGLKLEITPAVASKMRVTAFLDLSVSKSGAGLYQMFANVWVDGALPLNLQQLNFLGTAGTFRQTVAMSWEFSLTAAPHTIEIRGRLENTEGISSSNFGEYSVFDWTMAAS